MMTSTSLSTARSAFPRRAFRPARAQRGVVMFVAMIVLIVMTLAGLAMLRQMGSSSAIAGNLAFKRGATSSADLGIETARQFLTTTTNLTVDSAANNYYATWGAAPGSSTGPIVNEVDPTTGKWPDVWNTVVPLAADPVTNDSVRYVIQRLCALPLAPDAPGQDCAAAPGQVVNRGGPTGTPPPTPAPTPYYRVTAQVRGARNTVSYTQVVLGS